MTPPPLDGRGAQVLLAVAALACLAGAGAAQKGAAARFYELVRIQPLGAVESHATGVNEVGEVVGWYRSNDAHAFLWRASTGPIDLGEAPLQPASLASDVNRAGLPVGTSGTPVLWSGIASLFPFPTLGGSLSSQALGNNNHGRAVGIAALPGNDATGWVWDIGHGTRDLRALGVPLARTAVDINDARQIVGSQGFSRAYRFDLDMGTLTTLGSFGGGASEGLGLNHLGHVVGWALEPAFRQQPFLWTPAEGMKNLGNLDPVQPRDGRAASVNDADVVVGETGTGSGLAHAFVWDSGSGLRDLNALVHGRGTFVLVRATRISQNGWIVGDGVDTALGSSPAAFLLRPR